MATPDDLPYTSPARKLIRFFLNSRDQWKAKCQQAKATVKRLENRMRFLEKSKAEWKAKAKALEAENATLKAQARVMSMLEEAPAEKKNPLRSPPSPWRPALMSCSGSTITPWD